MKVFISQPMVDKTDEFIKEERNRMTERVKELYPDEEIELYLGAHKDDAAGNAYPDCSEEFTNFMYKAVYTGTGGYVKPIAPFVRMTKADIVKFGLECNVPYHLTWSCYEGGAKHCGTCGTCIDRKEAFKANAIEDPVEYME